VTNSRWFRTLAACLGICIPGLWLLSIVTPGEEAVKVRNALVVEMGRVRDFTWSPTKMPRDFRVNRAAPSTAYTRTADALVHPPGAPSRQGLELGLAIARHLRGHPEANFGSPIQSGLDETYKAIVNDRRGYCADFTFVFSGLAVAANLPVRTWSISFESFGAGHAFNEIYDRQLGKWILLDSYHGLIFVDPGSRLPLSVLEVHRRLLELGEEQRALAIERVIGKWLPFRSEQAALDYYRRGMPQLAMSWGIDVFDYDQSELIRAAALISRHLERAVGIATGYYPKMVVYPEGVSLRDLAALDRVRNRFWLAAVALAISCGVFGVMLYGTWIRS
jgi:hypothetical protein